MNRRFSKEELYTIRNRIPIDFVIRSVAKLRWEVQGGIFRFCCPVCGGFDTATNRHTNLARCFRCKRNFNTIDTVMLVSGSSFVQSVIALKKSCYGVMQRRSHKSSVEWKPPDEESIHQGVRRSSTPQSIKEILQELCL